MSAQTILRIDTSRMSDNALLIQGEVDLGPWDFKKEECIKPIGLLTINAEASVVSDLLLLQGDFEMAFEMVCDRCSEPFVHTIRLRSHAVQESLENRLIADLTDSVREDILLALPAYPHCDAAPDAPRCPAVEQFPETGEFAELDEDEEAAQALRPDEKSNVWNTLDQLKTNNDN